MEVKNKEQNINNIQIKWHYFGKNYMPADYDSASTVQLIKDYIYILMN